MIRTGNPLDLAANNMLYGDIKKYFMFWIEILYLIFCNYCSCEPARTRNNSAKRIVILNAIYGSSDRNEGGASSITQVPEKSNISNLASTSASHSNIDLTKSIQAMTNIIPISERLDGAETNPFTDRLDPILDQMKAAGIDQQHQPVVLVSLTNGKAREAANNVNLNDTTLNDLVDHIKELCLYDKDIQSRRATRLQDMKYSDFRAKHTTEDAANRDCIGEVTSYPKDLPKHLTSDATLLDIIEQLFANDSWCSMLFERSSGHQTALMFLLSTDLV